MARFRMDASDTGSPALPDTGLLSRAVRRDLVDLNLAYLELGVSLVDEEDPLVAWTAPVRHEIAAAERAVRARMAECPFSLFKISLPCDAEPNAGGPRVEDAAVRAPQHERSARCLEFSSAALFAAWRLADSAPLAARIVFGLLPAEELRLNELGPSQVGALAAEPGVVRARWPDRPRFWAALRSAAEASTPASLQWVYCMGVCLIEGGPSGSRGGQSAPPQGRRRR